MKKIKILLLFLIFFNTPAIFSQAELKGISGGNTYNYTNAPDNVRIVETIGSLLTLSNSVLSTLDSVSILESQLDSVILALANLDTNSFNSSAIINAAYYDSLGDAVAAFMALDTACLFIPPGIHIINSPLTFTFRRPGLAFWSIFGIPGASIIKAGSGMLDSTKNMFNFVCGGLTTYTDSVIAYLNISGLIFDMNSNGGTNYYWSYNDSCGHSLRTYRYDGNPKWDAAPDEGESATPIYTTQLNWVDSYGNILMTFGRLLTLNITNCEFKNSNGGGIRLRPVYNNMQWVAGVEGGFIDNCTFRAILGPAIQCLWLCPSSITNNYFRWVGCALYSSTGGWSFANNRIEEYDSVAVCAQVSNWFHITGNIFSEGSEAPIRIIGSSIGTISDNSFLNIVSDNSHMGYQCVLDTVTSYIELESYSFGGVANYPSLIITNNIVNSSSPLYDAYTKYFVESVYDGGYFSLTSSAIDSVKGCIISDNILARGLGHDFVLGISNLSEVRNIIKDNYQWNAIYRQPLRPWATTVDLNYSFDVELTDTYFIYLDNFSEYRTGTFLMFSPNTSNTGACTININSLGAKNIKTISGADPDNNDLLADKPAILIYDGTNMILINPATTSD